MITIHCWHRNAKYKDKDKDVGRSVREKDKYKDAGRSGCDCHDMLSACFQQVSQWRKEERAVSHEIIILPSVDSLWQRESTIWWYDVIQGTVYSQPLDGWQLRVHSF